LECVSQHSTQGKQDCTNRVTIKAASNSSYEQNARTMPVKYCRSRKQGYDKLRPERIATASLSALQTTVATVSTTIAKDVRNRHTNTFAKKPFKQRLASASSTTPSSKLTTAQQ
jgi:hypothetical protein